MEKRMLNYFIIEHQGILVLQPHAPLSKEDFSDLGAAVDSYLSDHAELHGVLIHAKGFPGWENFGGFTAHMHFVADHHKKIKRIAILTDSYFAGIAESLGNHFTSAELRHFPYVDDAKALEWLEAA
ncbi:MAG: STAS/SEC14 domain-containing protein [Burkholderiales bacterium]